MITFLMAVQIVHADAPGGGPAAREIGFIVRARPR
jgi:hypothetical protein